MTAGRTPVVGLNALFWTSTTAGVGTYARELVPALAAARPDWRFVLYVGRGFDQAGAGVPAAVKVRTAPVPASSWPARIAWERGPLARQARRDRVDLLHSLNGSGPVRAAMPLVVSTHDLIFEHWPIDYAPPVRALISSLFASTARASQGVIAGSEHAARDIRRTYGLTEATVHAVHYGPGATPAPPPAEAVEALRVRVAAEAGAPVVAVVGTAHHYKNLRGLIRAMGVLRRRRPGARLVVVGSLRDQLEPLRALAAEVDAGAEFLGWVDTPTLEAAYALADVVACPSLAEGFGLPLLEGFARDCAVVAGTLGPWPEVGADAAVYADAEDPEAFAGGLEHALDERDALRAKGRRRLADFSWARCAEGTIAVYERALAARP